jgi:hypothetical protein
MNDRIFDEVPDETRIGAHFAFNIIAINKNQTFSEIKSKKSGKKYGHY